MSAKSIRVDLEDEGFPGQFMELVDIGARSANQFKKVQDLVGDGSSEGARAFLAELIVDWHILNPETGDPIPTPSSAAFDVGDVPMRVLRCFGDRIREQVEAVVNPKGAPSPSS